MSITERTTPPLVIAFREALAMILEDKPISAVKHLRQEFGLQLIEAKMIVDELSSALAKRK